MTIKLSLLIVSLLLLSISCVKTESKNANPTTQNLIAQAQVFFERSIAGSDKNPNANNYRSAQPKSILWNEATVRHMSIGDVLIVPIVYRNNLFVSLKSAPYRAFKLSDLTSLVIMRNPNQEMHAVMITFVPDSISTVGSPSGLYLQEDWQGNSIPIHIGSRDQNLVADTPGSSNPKQADYMQNIQVCNEIDGYNYSPDDPSNGVSWSETSCTTYGFSSDALGSGLSGYTLSNLPLNRFLRSFKIIISPPGNPITNITKYFKCFTNGSSPDHSYTVQVCVDQPDPGTRQAWGFTPGGPIGSSSASNFVNTGHTFLILTENDRGNIISRNVGFYPSSLVIPTTSGSYSQGVLNNDQSHSYNISLTFNVTSTQFFNILNYVALGNNPGYYYNLNTNNCTTFVINALSTGGIFLPSTRGTWPGGSGNDPGDLGEDIRNMPLFSNMSRNTVDNDHPNIGSCN
ncbi:hypothetical protein [Puia dinghuensis]|uniref:DUF4105 domain-containing protein n=1 Tax=Puia dinghuensis TaxID=1792502 RepID=A0A8J2UIZ2_9BACT|nr:hypothetical protein [Puia dinghuensis]GGB23814.1 hypothetical protein GCM10011511_54620 [Puia dinghuensis]